MLEEERGLIDSLVVDQRGQAVALELGASEDDFARRLPAEAHLRKESINSRAGELLELGCVEGPRSKGISYTGKVNV
jgi:hypothetical protein